MTPTQTIMDLAYDLAGIALGQGKQAMVEARLGKRLRQLGCDLKEYARRVTADPAEQVVMLDLLTTNHTAWLREPAHFTDLEQRVLPALAARRARDPHPRLRIWCAAAATGEEPWTIALTLVRALPEIERWDVAVLATDISTRALARAEAGLYGEERIAALGAQDRQLALEVAERTVPKVYSVAARLRRLVHFARLNLMEDWPMRGPFDVIFCRNVMIYFDRDTQQRLVDRLVGLLVPGGTLYVGHAESLSSISHRLTPIIPAAYVR